MTPLPFRLYLYSYRGHMASRMICLHRFHTIGELDLDQPFCQTRRNDTKSISYPLWADCPTVRRPRTTVYCRPATPRVSLLKRTISFDTSKYVVATNDLRKHINYERLASFCPLLDVRACDSDDNNDGKCADDDDTPNAPERRPSFTALRRDGDRGERCGPDA